MEIGEKSYLKECYSFEGEYHSFLSLQERSNIIKLYVI